MIHQVLLVLVQEHLLHELPKARRPCFLTKSTVEVARVVLSTVRAHEWIRLKIFWNLNRGPHASYKAGDDQLYVWLHKRYFSITCVPVHKCTPQLLRWTCFELFHISHVHVSPQMFTPFQHVVWPGLSHCHANLIAHAYFISEILFLSSIFALLESFPNDSRFNDISDFLKWSKEPYCTAGLLKAIAILSTAGK